MVLQDTSEITAIASGFGGHAFLPGFFLFLLLMIFKETRQHFDIMKYFIENPQDHKPLENISIYVRMSWVGAIGGIAALFIGYVVMGSGTAPGVFFVAGFITAMYLWPVMNALYLHYKTVK